MYKVHLTIIKFNTYDESNIQYRIYKRCKNDDVVENINVKSENKS